MKVVRVFFFLATTVPSGPVATEEADDEEDFLLFLGASDLEPAVALVEDFPACCSWRPAEGRIFQSLSLDALSVL